MEQTGRIIWIPEREECAQEAEGAAPGYYLVLPKPLKAKRSKRPASTAARLFGPYGDFVTARFLDTSALSLGLLEQAAEPESVRKGAAQEKTPQRSAARPLAMPRTTYPGRPLRRPASDAWSSLARST